ncbi:angiopoietin-related protein 2-like [Pecten maximus]|uniref:angiopoietin-related protein 2-like n=1 Tax=Pecten maximus TaxID=6579 RepID=UPI0014588A13|nr:angiopoietin-related protein 2-like [Pecten maximus]
MFYTGGDFRMRIYYKPYLYLCCICCNVMASNYYAVLNGNISDYEILTNSTDIDDLPTCARRCEGQECKSFMYNFHTRVCSTFSSGLTASPGVSGNMNRFFQKEHEGVNCAPINVYGKWAKCNVFNSRRWAIVQRRYKGEETFDKTWDEFKAGFGDLDGEYWIGNEALHRLTHERNQSALFVIEDWNGVEKFAQYDSFKVSSEADKFRMIVSGYSGTAGDCMSYHSGMQFTTKDRDNDAHGGGSCSVEYDGMGFWYRICVRCNINAKYFSDTGTENTHALIWHTFSEKFQPMKKSRLMLAPTP